MFAETVGPFTNDASNILAIFLLIIAVYQGILIWILASCIKKLTDRVDSTSRFLTIDRAYETGGRAKAGIMSQAARLPGVLTPPPVKPAPPEPEKVKSGLRISQGTI